MTGGNRIFIVKQLPGCLVPAFSTTIILFYRNQVNNNTINVTKSGIKPGAGKLVLPGITLLG